jgi:hypothetical protein
MTELQFIVNNSSRKQDYKMNGFKFRGIDLPYYTITTTLPGTVNNERKAEIPLLKHFFDRFYKDEDFMEVGAVSNHYFYWTPDNQRKIYDATERFVIKALAEDLTYTNMKVLSISTIEHIGTGEYNLAANPYRCITVLNKMLEAKVFLITFPIGANPLLDTYVEHVVLRFNPAIVSTISRSADETWTQDENVKMDYKYNSPLPCGNGICVITNAF